MVIGTKYLFDDVLRYQGFAKCVSKCQMTAWIHAAQLVIMLSELPDNTGTSVTNFSEGIATLLLPQIRGWGFHPENVKWIEHYPGGRTLPVGESFDQIFYKWDGQRYSEPRWQRLNPSDSAKLGIEQ